MKCRGLILSFRDIEVAFIHMHMYLTCIHRQACTDPQTETCMHARKHSYMLTHTHAHTHTHTHTCTYTCMHIHVHSYKPHICAQKCFVYALENMSSPIQPYIVAGDDFRQKWEDEIDASKTWKRKHNNNVKVDHYFFLFRTRLC